MTDFFVFALITLHENRVLFCCSIFGVFVSVMHFVVIAPGEFREILS